MFSCPSAFQRHRAVQPSAAATRTHVDCQVATAPAVEVIMPPRPTTACDPLVLGFARTAPVTAKAFDGTHVRAVANAVQRMCDEESVNRFSAEPTGLPPALAAVMQRHAAPEEKEEDGSLDFVAAAVHEAIVGTRVPAHERLTVFHSVTYPEIGLYDLACALANNCGIDAHTHLVAFVLMGRAVATLLAMPDPVQPTLVPILHALRPSGIVQTNGMPTSHMIHRLFVACVHVAVKVHWDRTWRTRSFARLAGVGTAELIAAEAIVLYMCDWRTVVTAGDLDRIIEDATLRRVLSAFACVPAPVDPLQEKKAEDQPAAVGAANTILAFMPGDAIGVDLTASALELEESVASPLPAGHTDPLAVACVKNPPPKAAHATISGGSGERDAAYLAA